MTMEPAWRQICRNSEEESSKEGVMPEDLSYLSFEGWKDYEEVKRKNETCQLQRKMEGQSLQRGRSGEKRNGGL